MANHKEKTRRWIITAAKVLVMAGVVLFIYLKIKDEQNFSREIILAMRSVISQNPLTLLFVILLMPINWLLEGVKWRLLAKPVKKLSLQQAMRGVLAGLSIAFITPHGIGDYLGRVMSIEKQERSRLIGAVFLGRIMQMMATLFFGALGIYFLLGNIFTYVYLLLLICLLISCLLLLYFPIRFKGKFFRKFIYYIEIIGDYSKSTIWQVMILSCLRYLVFAFQFFIVLHLFVSISTMLKVAGTTWIFLAKSILPTFNFLSDLGVREFSAVYFFEQFGTPLIPVLAASLLVWIVNILAPTIFGLPFIYKLRIKP